MPPRFDKVLAGLMFAAVSIWIAQGTPMPFTEGGASSNSPPAIESN